MTTEGDVLTSATLLRQLASPGNDQAWRAFLDRYQPLLNAWCRRWGLQHNDAEDVSAAVLAKLVQQMHRFVYDPARCFRAWLRRVVDNEVRSLWRQRCRRPADRGSGDSEIGRRLAEIPAPPDSGELVRGGA
jgi:RNA polymerase sigma-70 factor (ECF subfamily)